MSVLLKRKLHKKFLLNAIESTPRLSCKEIEIESVVQLTRPLELPPVNLRAVIQLEACFVPKLHLKLKLYLQMSLPMIMIILLVKCPCGLQIVVSDDVCKFFSFFLSFPLFSSSC